MQITGFDPTTGLLSQLRVRSNGSLMDSQVDGSALATGEQTLSWLASAVVNTWKKFDVTAPTNPLKVYELEIVNPSKVTGLDVKVCWLEEALGGETRRISRYVGNVPAASSLLVEDCEDVWSYYTGGTAITGVTNDQGATTYKKVGTYSVKVQCAAEAAVGLLACESAFSALNLSPYTHIRVWLYSTIAVTAGQLQLLLDPVAGCLAPTETLDIPALEANTWTKCWLRLADPTLDKAIITVGVKQTVDLGAFDLYIDDVWAVESGQKCVPINGFFGGGGNTRVYVGNDTALGALDAFSAYVRVRAG